MDRFDIILMSEASYKKEVQTVEDSSRSLNILVKAARGFWFPARSIALLFFTVALFAQEVPIGTTLEVRLSSATGSHSSHRGDPIEASIIAPVSVQGRILIPQGSSLLGFVANADAIGFGLKHVTAAISYVFETIRLPSGTTIPVKTQLVEVDTAKERVDDLGIVHGIHPIVSLSSSLAFYTVPLLLIDPTIGIPIWGAKSLIAPSANPEIYFPVGTELTLRLTAGANVPVGNTDFDSVRSLRPGDIIEIDHLLKSSAQRAEMGTHSSDVVNLVLVGSRQQMERAFQASGWSQAQKKSPIALFRMYHALTKRHGYANAPMNTLTLNGVPSVFVYQKSLNTVQKRHHVRWWQYPGRTDIWLGAAAEDVGFRFKLAHWTHSTDPNIDSERGKVVNDLAFSGCVEAAGLAPRSSTALAQSPEAEYPAVTDGQIAVVRLTDCIHPNLMAGVSDANVRRPRGRLPSALAAFGDDVARSNIVFTTYNTIKFFAKGKAKQTTADATPSDSNRGGLDWLPPIATLENGSAQRPQ
jgi:LssY C-terminus